MRLWVDDIRNPGREDWHWAKTITEAIRILSSQSVSDVSLDHDICHTLREREGIIQPFVCPETYESVARFIAARPGNIKRVHVHTSNPAGADRMASIIRDAQPHIKLSRRLGYLYEEAHKDGEVDLQD